jgi:hypothetical protein
MRTLCEATYQDENDEEVKEKVWLLHFGLQYTVINDIGVNYTVAIVENYGTGQIEMFDPQQLKIIGTEVKK